jgi:hypothetical protein
MSAAVFVRYLKQVPSAFPLHVSRAQSPSRRKLPSVIVVGVNMRSGPIKRRLPHSRWALTRTLGLFLGCRCPCIVAKLPREVPAQICAAARLAVPRCLPRSSPDRPVRTGSSGSPCGRVLLRELCIARLQPSIRNRWLLSSLVSCCWCRCGWHVLA